LVFSGTNLFAETTGGGVFLSTNNGINWSSVSNGLSSADVYALAVSPDGMGGANLFVGTYGRGVWKRPLSEMVTGVEKLQTDLPTHFYLDQNYPNPFNPSTTISFTLPSKSVVSLKVFDLIGREVATIVSEEMSEGNHTEQWNAENYTSGVYFYRLHAETFTETKKLVLLK
jgi:hypothetical protein